MKLAKQLLMAPLLIAAIAILAVGALTWSARTGMSEMRMTMVTRVDAANGMGTAREELVQIRAEVFRALTIISSMNDDAVKAVLSDLSARTQNVIREIHEGGAKLPAEQRDKSIQLVTQFVKQAARAIELSTIDPNVGVGAMRIVDPHFETAITG